MDVYQSINDELRERERAIQEAIRINNELQRRQQEAPMSTRPVDLFLKIREYITDAQNHLQSDELLSLWCLTPTHELILVQSVGFDDPLITVRGVTQEGQECTVLTSMHSVQLVAKVQRLAPEQAQAQPERRPIGFYVPNKDQKEGKQEGA
ncbi:MAG: hypothetical protein OHK0022_30360 [Roseiflexaceae bacterium]